MSKNEAEIEEFYNLLSIKPLPTGAIALWHALNFLQSRYQTEWFTAANRTLESFTGLSRQSINDNRNILKQNGLADFKSNGTKASSYKLTMSNNLQVALQDSLQNTLQNNLQNACTLNKLNYIKLLSLFKFLIKEREKFENLSENDRDSIVFTLKRLNLYADNESVLNYVGEEQKVNYLIIYWCIKELYLSSFKVYLNDIDEQFLKNKYFKTLEMLNIEKVDIETDIEDIVCYFIKTLKREYEVKK